MLNVDVRDLFQLWCSLLKFLIRVYSFFFELQLNARGILILVTFLRVFKFRFLGN